MLVLAMTEPHIKHVYSQSVSEIWWGGLELADLLEPTWRRREGDARGTDGVEMISAW
jgi:hypothetical protein